VEVQLSMTTMHSKAKD